MESKQRAEQIEKKSTVSKYEVMIDEHKWPPWQNKWQTDFRMRPMKEEDKPLPSRIQARQFIFLPVFLLFKNI